MERLTGDDDRVLQRRSNVIDAFVDAVLVAHSDQRAEDRCSQMVMCKTCAGFVETFGSRPDQGFCVGVTNRAA